MNFYCTWANTNLIFYSTFRTKPFHVFNCSFLSHGHISKFSGRFGNWRPLSIPQLYCKPAQVWKNYFKDNIDSVPWHYSAIRLYQTSIIEISYNFSGIQTAIHITSRVLYFISLPKQIKSPYRSKLHACYWKDLLSIGHIHGVSYFRRINNAFIHPYHFHNPTSSKTML